jgi:dATP pyrophosphohydrolase
MAAKDRYKRPVSVLVVVFNAAGEFMLLNRVKPSGFWQSVTGSLLPGESPRNAAVRELKEETGLLGAAQLVNLHQTRLFPIIKPWRKRYATGVCFNREHWFALPLPARRLERALGLASSWTNREAMRMVAQMGACG